MAAQQAQGQHAPQASRVAQPHQALRPEYQAAAAAGAATARGAAAGRAAIQPDTERVILHFDVDCFYAQCEERRDPSLVQHPLGISQKQIVVTCNRVARARGVTKLMSCAEARKRCPDLVLISGEDLTPFRAASKQIFAVLQRFGTAERLGLDETYLDVTAEVRRRLAAPVQALRWHGHVHSSSTALVAESQHRPMDLRVQPASASATSAAGAAVQPPLQSEQPPEQPWAAALAAASDGWQAMLMVGSAIAAEARAAVNAQTGFRCSAGIACNKLLAKLASGLHKPDDQTVLPPTVATAFVAPLPCRALRGVGHVMDQELQALGIRTAAELRSLGRGSLAWRFGEQRAAFLFHACRGKDPTPVQESGPPKSITVEDSFRSCCSWQAVEQVVSVLAPDVLARLREDAQEHGRRPVTLTVKWRAAAQGYFGKRSSASCPMPATVLRGTAPRGGGGGAPAPPAGGEREEVALREAAVALLRRHLPSPFDLSLINIGATAFSDTSSTAGMRTIVDMLAPAQKPQQQQQQQRQQKPEAQRTRLPPCSPDVPGLARMLGSTPAAAAAAQVADLSARHRRDYGAAVEGPLLSKRVERSLREQVPGQQQQQGQQQALGSSEELWDGLEEEEEEGDDGCRVWNDLRTLSASAAPGDGGGGSDGDGTRPARKLRRVDTAVQASRTPPAGGRVAVHCDVDRFYCQCEVLDDPSLRGRSLVVQQFRSGGFVSVSCEARAAGIRCGDGAGAVGRAVVPHLVDTQAVGIEECMRRCPGLEVRPMRTGRYRQIAHHLHQLVRKLEPDCVVERTSHDDFYLELPSTAASSACGDAGAASTTHDLGGPPHGLRFASGSQPVRSGETLLDATASGTGSSTGPGRPPPGEQWERLAPDLQQGVLRAQRLRTAMQSELGLALSCSVARNKLVARLAAPLAKPDGLAVVDDAEVLPFIRATPLRKVPSLRGKLGDEVCATLGVGTVGDLLAVPRQRLLSRFGQAKGEFLAGLPHAQDNTPVRERGPQKSICAERSFPPLLTEGDVLQALLQQAETLIARVLEDTIEHGRQPATLTIAYRQGYGQNCRSKGLALPPCLGSWLAAAARQQQPQPQQQQQQLQSPSQPPAAEVAEVALAALRGAVGGEWQVTRLSVGVTFPDDSGASGGGRSAAATGQQPISAFLVQQQATQQQAVPPSGAIPPASGSDARQPSPPPPPQRAPPRPAAAARPRPGGNYRNAEAVALLEQGASLLAGARGGEEELGEEERASLALALRLQEQELRAAATFQRPVQATSVGIGSGAGTGAGRRRSSGSEMARRGPMDAFLKRAAC